MEALADELLKGKKKERNNATDDWNEYQRQWREKNKLSYHETQARYHLKKVRALREEESLLYEK